MKRMKEWWLAQNREEEARISSSCCINKRFDEQKGVAVYAVVSK
jgi:hypothetical protein